MVGAPGCWGNLPGTVHRPSTHRDWLRRFYDLTVRSEKKCLEKPDCTNANPVKRDIWPAVQFISRPLYSDAPTRVSYSVDHPVFVLPTRKRDMQR